MVVNHYYSILYCFTLRLKGRSKLIPKSLLFSTVLTNEIYAYGNLLSPASGPPDDAGPGKGAGPDIRAGLPNPPA